MLSLSGIHAGVRARVWGIALLGAGQGACLVKDVPADRYADAASYAEEDSSDAEAGADADPDDDSVDSDDAGGDGDEPDVEADAGALPPNPSCDFTGRWLITERLVVTGIGIQQATLWWLYLEVAQSGDVLRVRKGLLCGTAGNRVGALGVTIDMHKSWPAVQTNNDPSARTGKATLVSGRCQVQWNKSYRVIGATVPHYLDPKRPLPTTEQPAKGDTAGWEDWDEDGKPGVSINISGALNGTRYSASRLWTSYAGSVDKNATKFRLSMDWNQEESVLGVTTDALKAAGVKDGDPKLHVAYFAKLSDTEAVGDDDQICATIRDLAPTLTADAY